MCIKTRKHHRQHFFASWINDDFFTMYVFNSLNTHGSRHIIQHSSLSVVCNRFVLNNLTSTNVIPRYQFIFSTSLKCLAAIFDELKWTEFFASLSQMGVSTTCHPSIDYSNSVYLNFLRKAAKSNNVALINKKNNNSESRFCSLR